jgi:hypothetical protein
MASRFRLIVGAGILLALLGFLWLCNLLFEDYVVTTFKEATVSHHWEIGAKIIYLLTTYPTRSAVIITCAFLLGSEAHNKVKGVALWKAVFGNGEKVAIPDNSQGLSGKVERVPSLPERARQLAKELEAFIDANSGSAGPDVYKINFLYAAHYRDKVDRMLNELAAEQIFDVCEDWVINPQTQTAKNIRANIIDHLNSLADRLDAKNAAKARPVSKNVGTRDWPGEWLDSESRFRKLERSGVFAELFAGKWSLRRDRNDDNSSARDEMEAACELAGGRLANSPGIAISDAVKGQTEHWVRWLQFVKEEQGLNRTFDGPRAKDNGYIEGLARVSAIVCTKCAARAHDS